MVRNISNTFKAFLSHQKVDKEFTEAIGTHLRHTGVDIFFDKWDILGGDSIPQELEKAISECNIFIYILSSSSIRSKWVQEEYYAFLYRKINEHDLRIIPILREKCIIPPFLAPLHYINFQNFDEKNLSNYDIKKVGPFKELLESIFKVSKKPQIGSIHPAFASYEFYFQPQKGKPINADGTLNFELGFKNITNAPLLNFVFTLIFREPIISIVYDFSRSSANMTGGEGLTNNNTKFNWLGNQIVEDGGWVVFVILSKTEPVIIKLSTKLIGRVVGTNQIIHPDPSGV